MKKIAILQSNYIPWKGYFDMIAAVDEFILYDDMQFTKRDWRNRNQIKTPQGAQWLTVPVKVKGKYHQTIRETEIEGAQWARDHWKTLSQNYRRAACFKEIADWLEPLYLAEPPTHLSQVNRRFIEAICEYPCSCCVPGCAHLRGLYGIANHQVVDAAPGPLGYVMGAWHQSGQSALLDKQAPAVSVGLSVGLAPTRSEPGHWSSDLGAQWCDLY